MKSEVGESEVRKVYSVSIVYVDLFYRNFLCGYQFHPWIHFKHNISVCALNLNDSLAC